MFIQHEVAFTSSWNRVETEDGRFYECVDHIEQDKIGLKYPSATTLLSKHSSNNWVKEWREKVGEESANATSRIASAQGTQLHKCAELYLLNKDPYKGDVEVPHIHSIVKPRFERFKRLLNNISEVYCLEHMMGSTKLGIGGTVDCIAVYKGVLSVVDFKTSKKMKTEEEIQSYFAQVTTYAAMFWEMTGIKINQLVILISVETSTKDQEFIVKPDMKYLKGII